MTLRSMEKKLKTIIQLLTGERNNTMSDLSPEEQRFVDKTIEVMYLATLTATCVAVLWWVIAKVMK